MQDLFEPHYDGLLTIDIASSVDENNQLGQKVLCGRSPAHRNGHQYFRDTRYQFKVIMKEDFYGIFHIDHEWKMNNGSKV